MNDVPLVMEIEEIKEESPEIKTFFFNAIMDYQPGQFVMVWLPRIGEKPFAVSYLEQDKLGITVEKKGKFTTAMLDLKVGDKIGIRGPYGNSFDIKKDNACVIAGGLGMVPMATLIPKLNKPTVICGARTGDCLLFLDRFKDSIITTDDGTCGKKCFTTDVLEELLAEKKFDVVYTCGPEIMMKKVFELCEKHGIECQASLERYMKCGYGVCGQCTCGKNLVCKDGPVFKNEQLKEMDEFGNTARLKSGKKVPLKEYYEWRSK